MTATKEPTTYTRDTIDSLPHTGRNHSARYWRCQAREIFDDHPDVHIVRIIQYKKEIAPAPDTYHIIPSTGGKWGKSRRNYAPMEQ